MNIYACFKCNMHCQFCALCHLPGKPIDLKWLRRQLEAHSVLCHDINILGGEPSILPDDYQEKLVDLCTEMAKEPPVYITNLLKVSPVISRTKPVVSYDGKLRPHSDIVRQNMLSLEVPFSISSIMTDYLVEEIGPAKYLAFIERFPALVRADLMLYRSGTTPVDNTPNHDKLMDFVRAVMDHPKVNMTPYSGLKGNIRTDAENIAGYFGFLPDNRYGVNIDYQHMGYTPFNTFEEALTYYNERVSHFRKTEPCASCTFDLRCWRNGGYEDGKCHGDREMMELFQQQIREEEKHVCSSV